MALAGDQNNPEVSDETGETTEPQRQFRDIEAAWFSESNTTIIVQMKLVGPPPDLYQFAQNIDTTTFDYEVYFDVEGVGYAVSVSIQYAFVAGTIYTFDVPWVWELREVNYAMNTDIIQAETVKFNFNDDENSNAQYDPEGVTLKWEVYKEAVGVGLEWEGRGQELVNTWAAVWNANDNSADSQRDPSTQAWDYAHTHHSDPGMDYRVTGFGGVDYNIVLSVDGDEKVTFGGTPVEFLVHAKNDGTETFSVGFFPQYSDASWSVVLSEYNITIAQGKTKTIGVIVTPPKDVENGTELIVRIEGNIHMIDGNGTVPVQPPLTLRTIALSLPDEENEGGWLEDLAEMLKQNLAIIAAVIAVMVVAIIVLAVLIKK
jgi:hypothetical protein